MSLRTRIVRAMYRASTSLVGPNAWETFGLVSSQAGASGRLNLPGMSRPAENVLWAYAAITARAEAMMQAAVRISNAGGDLVESGPLADLLARPNRWQDGVAFVGSVETCLALYNRAFVAAVSEKGALPDELLVLPPTNVTAQIGVHTATGMRVPVGWIVRDAATGREQRFELDELIAIQTWNPHNPYITALSPTDPLKRSLQMDIATRESNLALFSNGGLPDFALTTDRDWEHDSAKEFLRRFMDNYSGFGNAHKPALLYNGVKIQPIGLKPEELQSLEVLRNLTPQEIVAGFRCKPAMAGLMVGETGLSQGTSTAEQKVAWWSETGFSEAGRIAAALQQFLVERYPWPAARGSRKMSRLQRIARTHCLRQARVAMSGLSVWLDTTQVPELAQHRLSRIGEMQKLWSMGYPPDALNEFFDLGLPDHPRGTQGLVPFSVQPVDEVGGSVPAIATENAAVSVAGAATVQDTALNGAQIASLLLILHDLSAGVLDESGAVAAIQAAFPMLSSDVVTQIVAGVQPAAAPDEPRQMLAGIRARIEAESRQVEARAKAGAKAIRTAYESFLKPRIKATSKRYSRYYLEQEARIMDRLDKAIGRARATDDRPLSDSTTESKLLNVLFPKSDENNSLTALITPLVQAHMADGWAFFRQVDAPAGATVLDFQIADPRVQAAIEDRVIHATLVNDTTEEALRKILSDSFAEGDTPAMLADRIDAYYAANAKGPTAARPMTAALTQTNGVVNEGRLLAANFAGGLLKGWLHGSSEDPRAAHVAAESTYTSAPLPLDGQFVVNGHACSAPGDSSLPIEETANCTCTLIFVPQKGA